MPDNVLTYFAQALSVLNALVAGGIVKTSSGIVLTSLLGDVSAVVSGARNPSVDEVALIAKLFADLKADNILGGAFVDQLSVGLTQFHSFVANIQNNQVAIARGNTSCLGVRGAWAFIPALSDQGKSLGMS